MDARESLICSCQKPRRNRIFKQNLELVTKGLLLNIGSIHFSLLKNAITEDKEIFPNAKNCNEGHLLNQISKSLTKNASHLVVENLCVRVVGGGGTTLQEW